jgi:hypothetical protein
VPTEDEHSLIADAAVPLADLIASLHERILHV